MKAATLAIFQHLYASVAEQMGVALGRTALSPNIKERLDFSCALFTHDGRLLAQAAHIPVHLGAMPASVKSAIERCQPFSPGDVIILNDPYLGGTHLPDVTLISPLFTPRYAPTSSPETLQNASVRQPAFFVASRAHHADIGGMTPGSMPISVELFQEGLVIPPLKLQEAGQMNWPLWQLILSNVRTPEERAGDLHAQLAANKVGLRRLGAMLQRYGLDECLLQAGNLIDYAERLTRAAIEKIPDGRYEFVDHVEGDGQLDRPLKLHVVVTVEGPDILVDFSGTDAAMAGNLNAVPSITISAVSYCIRCLALAILGVELPMNEGAISPLQVRVPPRSLLNPARPNAVAAGNVETSQRVVDVVFGALSLALPDLVPAASQGTMNNLTFGYQDRTAESESTVREFSVHAPHLPAETPAFAYYETIGGGVGAGPDSAGGHGMHVHMSNTRNTPVEALEYTFPIQVREYALRKESGGAGLHRGGDGLIREIGFRAPVRLTIISERRKLTPYGLRGGLPGTPGRNTLIRGLQSSSLPGNVTVDLAPGDSIRIETPGGGGWGAT